MRKQLSYWTGGPTLADVERGLAALAEELGHSPLESNIEPRRDGFYVTFVVEVPEPTDPLLSRIQRALDETSSTSKVDLSWCEGFADLYWEPFDPREMWINEIVRLEGPCRYGVVGHLSGEYRICARSNDGQPYEPGFVATEPDLEQAVDRVMRFIELGSS